MKSANEKRAARKVRTHVDLTPDQYAALRSLSEQRRVPVAAFVRDAVDEWLRAHGARWVAK